MTAVESVVESGVELFDGVGSFISSSSEPDMYPLPIPRFVATPVDDPCTDGEEVSLDATFVSMALLGLVPSSDIFVNRFHQYNSTPSKRENAYNISSFIHSIA